MLCTDLADRLPLGNMFFEPGKPGGMVVIAASGKMGDLKQRSQRIVSP